jgi:hypothetical protein
MGIMFGCRIVSMGACGGGAGMTEICCIVINCFCCRVIGCVIFSVSLVVLGKVSELLPWWCFSGIGMVLITDQSTGSIRCNLSHKQSHET